MRSTNKTKPIERVSLVKLYWGDVEYSGDAGDSREREVGPCLSLAEVKRLQRKEVLEMNSWPGRRGASISGTRISFALKLSGRYYELEGSPLSFVKVQALKGIIGKRAETFSYGGRLYKSSSPSYEILRLSGGLLEIPYLLGSYALIIGSTAYILKHNSSVDIKK